MGKKPGFVDFTVASKRALAIATDKNIRVHIYNYLGTFHLSSVAPDEYLAKRPKATSFGFVQADPARKI